MYTNFPECARIVLELCLHNACCLTRKVFIRSTDHYLKHLFWQASLKHHFEKFKCFLSTEVVLFCLKGIYVRATRVFWSSMCFYFVRNKVEYFFVYSVDFYFALCLRSFKCNWVECGARVILYNIAFITQHNSHNFMFEETGARANFEGLRNTYLYVYIVPVLKYNPR